MAALGKLEGHDVVIVGWGGRGAWQLKYWRGWIGGVVGQPLAPPGPPKPRVSSCPALLPAPTAPCRSPRSLGSIQIFVLSRRSKARLHESELPPNSTRAASHQFMLDSSLQLGVCDFVLNPSAMPSPSPCSAPEHVDGGNGIRGPARPRESGETGFPRMPTRRWPRATPCMYKVNKWTQLPDISSRSSTCRHASGQQAWQGALCARGMYCAATPSGLQKDPAE
jgi:hypothetical protein